MQPSLVRAAPSATCFPPQRPASQCAHTHTRSKHTCSQCTVYTDTHTYLHSMDTQIHTNRHTLGCAQVCTQLHPHDACTHNSHLHTQAHCYTLTRDHPTPCTHACACKHMYVATHKCSRHARIHTNVYPKFPTPGTFGPRGPRLGQGHQPGE